MKQNHLLIQEIWLKRSLYHWQYWEQTTNENKRIV